MATAIKFKPTLAAYNAKIQSLLGEKLLSDNPWRSYKDPEQNLTGGVVYRDPWDRYFGVEFELEVDLQSPAIRDFLETLSAEDRKTALSRDEYKNTWLAHEVARKVLPTCKDIAIAKRDGSMQNGVEFVSLPMSLTMHQRAWGKFFESVNEHGLTVKKTCGMHVHVSRDHLTDLQIGKILNWLHNPLNGKLVRYLAGRLPPDKYANIKTPYKIKDAVSLKQRYTAFNLTNTHTIEFRIFKGVADERRFLCNLEFCAALVSFCGAGVTSLRELNAATFLKYVSANGSIYRNLEAFLISRRLLKRRHKKPQPKYLKQAAKAVSKTI